MILILLFHKKYVKLGLKQKRKEIIKIIFVTILTILFTVFLCKMELPIASLWVFIIYSLVIILLYMILLCVMKVSLVWTWVLKIKAIEKNNKK